ncbi:MAG: hypothetical protein J5787_09850 [Alphaproteobacteria bacterium]|nr:hypothetical protein [Alphaproteobacteria bacterium]
MAENDKREETFTDDQGQKHTRLFEGDRLLSEVTENGENRLRVVYDDKGQTALYERTKGETILDRVTYQDGKEATRYNFDEESGQAFNESYIYDDEGNLKLSQMSITQGDKVIKRSKTTYEGGKKSLTTELPLNEPTAGKEGDPAAQEEEPKKTAAEELKEALIGYKNGKNDYKNRTQTVFPAMQKFIKEGLEAGKTAEEIGKEYDAIMQGARAELGMKSIKDAKAEGYTDKLMTLDGKIHKEINTLVGYYDAFNNKSQDGDKTMNADLLKAIEEAAYHHAMTPGESMEDRQDMMFGALDPFMQDCIKRGIEPTEAKIAIRKAFRAAVDRAVAEKSPDQNDPNDTRRFVMKRLRYSYRDIYNRIRDVDDNFKLLSRDDHMVSDVRGTEGIEEPPVDTPPVDTEEHTGGLKDEMWRLAWKTKYMSFEHEVENPEEEFLFARCKAETMKSYQSVPPSFKMDLETKGSSIINSPKGINLTHEGKADMKDTMTVVRLAKEKGWKTVKIDPKASPSFKRNMYISLLAQGLDVANPGELGFTSEILKELQEKAEKLKPTKDIARTESMDKRFEGLDEARREVLPGKQPKKAFVKVDDKLYQQIQEKAEENAEKAKAPKKQSLQSTLAGEQKETDPERTETPNVKKPAMMDRLMGRAPYAPRPAPTSEELKNAKFDPKLTAQLANSNTR